MKDLLWSMKYGLKSMKYEVWKYGMKDGMKYGMLYRERSVTAS